MKKVKLVSKQLLVKRNPIEDSMDTLRKEFKKDPGYYMAWEANIACVIHDNTGIDMIDCNPIAKKIINHIFQI